MTTKAINQWLGYGSGYIQLPNMDYRIKVFAVRKHKGNLILSTMVGYINAQKGMIIEHGVRVNDTITL